MAWWQKAVVYQIYPRSFMDASGDGIGDLAGVMQRLDYLAWLGIDAIWFSPLFPSPMYDFGYDVADYRDIHPDYGTLDDFDKLLIEAHSRGMKILLDLVPNHTSSLHAWFQESRASRDNPKRDWYIWRDPKPDGSPPNNWLSYFGGPAWTFDETTGQYYLHNFVSQQPDLNYRNPDVVEAMFDVIRFWLARGIDGFRVDVIDRVMKDPEFRDNPPNPDWKPGDPEVGSLLRIHSESAPDTHDMMRQFRKVFNEYSDKVLIGEIAYGLNMDQYAAFFGDQKGDTGDELHMPFNFGLIGKSMTVEAIKSFVDAYDAAIPTFGWPNYVLGNHDVPRLASAFGTEKARIAAMLLLTLRGTPTLYYGDEIGMENVPVPEDRIQDPQGRNKAGFNRDECRAPMQWDDSAHAGFSTTTGDPWLAVAPDFARNNVATHRDDDDSTLNLYRRLLAYRKATPSLQLGRYYAIDDAPEGCFAYIRQYNDQRRLVLLNMTDAMLEASFDYDAATVGISTAAARDGERVDPRNVTLAPYEGLVLEI